ncbi:MAG: hypothetical protein MHPSP_003530, partial [Paramarteilia canceri]
MEPTTSSKTNSGDAECCTSTIFDYFENKFSHSENITHEKNENVKNIQNIKDEYKKKLESLDAK